MTEPVALRRLSLPELDEKVQTLRRQMFVLRIQHSQRQLAKHAQIRTTRRELARVLTLTAEKRREGVKE